MDSDLSGDGFKIRCREDIRVLFYFFLHQDLIPKLFLFLLGKSPNQDLSQEPSMMNGRRHGRKRLRHSLPSDTLHSFS